MIKVNEYLTLEGWPGKVIGKISHIGEREIKATFVDKEGRVYRDHYFPEGRVYRDHYFPKDYPTKKATAKEIKFYDQKIAEEIAREL